MGCGAYRIIFEDNTDTPLDWSLTKVPKDCQWMNESEIELMNSYYTKAQLIIEMVEDLRETIIDSLDELIMLTGAYVFTNPNIILCIKCVLWKVSADNKGNLKQSEISFYDDEPYFQIRGGSITPETTRIISNLVTYISNFFSIKNQIKHTDLKIPELIYIISEKFENFIHDKSIEKNKLENFYPKKSLSPINKNKLKPKYLQIIQDNNIKIKKTVDLFPDLIAIYNENLEKVKYEFFLILKDPRYITNIDKVGEYAISKSLYNIVEIAFNSKNVEFLKQETNDEEDKTGEENNYTKSISEGRARYEEILQSKQFLKNKRKSKKILNRNNL